MLRLFKGDISLTEIENMPRKELMMRVQARMDALSNDNEKVRAMESMRDIEKEFR